MRRFAIAILLVTLGAAPAYGENFCRRWNATDDLQVKRGGMLRTLQRFGSDRIDQRCVRRRLDAFVRWTNRTCAAGGVDNDTFALELYREALKLCP